MSARFVCYVMFAAQDLIMTGGDESVSGFVRYRIYAR
jgi:hypothetical protein